MTHYFIALGLTILVEAIVLALLTKPPVRRRLVVASVFVNCLTHPIAYVLTVGGLPIFAAVEVGVVFAEAWIYSSVVPARFGRALLWSSTANAATIALSFVI